MNDFNNITYLSLLRRDVFYFGVFLFCVVVDYRLFSFTVVIHDVVIRSVRISIGGIVTGIINLINSVKQAVRMF
jgi:hypothetical protein